jgi:hypothetical protein
VITFFVLVTIATLIGVAIGTSFSMIEGEGE